jgi:hypothetical protein
VTSVILGARRPDQLRDNLLAAQVRLSDAELDRLDAVSRIPREYPQWMLEHRWDDRVVAAAPDPEPRTRDTTPHRGSERTPATMSNPLPATFSDTIAGYVTAFDRDADRLGLRTSGGRDYVVQLKG